jgi:hypothetical protein
MDPHKRELRKFKRELKRAGSKHRRRHLKRELTNNPDEAHHSEESFGGCSSEGLNGQDKDATRRPPPDPSEA